MHIIKNKIISLLLISVLAGNILSQLSHSKTFNDSIQKESVISAISETFNTSSNLLPAKKVSNNYERLNYNFALRNSSKLILSEERYLFVQSRNMSVEYRDKNFFTFLYSTGT